MQTTSGFNAAVIYFTTSGLQLLRFMCVGDIKCTVCRCWLWHKIIQ